MIHIRNENKALQLGSYKTILADDEKNIFVFEREYKGEKIVVVINNSTIEQQLTVKYLNEKCFTDLLSSKTFSNNEKITVNRKYGLILKPCL